ncbi:MAG: methylated-DNA--[protein]-cysteine S-methyltransferase [Nocardiopsaceae bacterium]|jgi:methylated-DNA-[protein]-cysteine S-methyltransferase|nr:methylated-DNA--[protein]-cysteine S-methyltransferase [Nocardiopsaceae bacterium]
MSSRTRQAGDTGARQRSHTVIGSPIGPLTLIAGNGRLAGVHMEITRYEPDPVALGAAVDCDDEPVLAAAANQLDAYFDGELIKFDLPLSLDGSRFQRTVWAALQDIPYGETISYGELAGRIGQPSASRAVGLANGRNPVSIVVPCHRVIGANGSLTGYGGGMDRKRFLLALEQRVSGQTLI